MTTLAIHSGALGDLVLFGRLCERLGGDVTLVTGRAKGNLLVGLGAAAGAIDFDLLPMHEAFSDRPLDQCLLTRRLGGYDRLVSCFAAGDRAAELRLAAICGAESAAFLPIRPEPGFKGHLLELWCDLLGESMSELPRTTWPVPEAWRKQGVNALRKLGLKSSPTVIHPGSGGAAKCWPLERFVELAGRLKGRGDEVLMVLGPAEIDRWGERRIGPVRGQLPLLESPSLELLAGVLAGCRAYAGNDSGASHLAAAVGAASLVLFGPSNSTHFAPLGPSVKVHAKPSLADLTTEEVMRMLS